MQKFSLCHAAEWVVDKSFDLAQMPIALTSFHERECAWDSIPVCVFCLGVLQHTVNQNNILT